jgi:Rhs element Vgr protein
MPETRRLPITQNTDLPGFKIFSEGSQVSAEYQVLSIVVIKEANRISTAKISFRDGSPSEEDFPISNSDEFIPGKAIDIEAGYHGDEEVIFKGIVIKNSLRARQNKPSVFEVVCADKAVKLTVGRKNKYFEETSDSDIIEQITADAGLDSDVESTSVTHQSMVQYYASDWDFIVSRAEANGKLVFTDDNTLIVKKADLSASPELSLLYGGNIISFESEMDARDQFAGVKALSWDKANQETLEIESSAFAGNLPGNITPETLSEVIGLDSFKLDHGGSIPDVELQEWADAQNQKSKISKIKGRIQIQGYSGVKPGQMVEIGGMGDRFNGNAFVSAVRHEINPSNWITNIGVGISRKWFAEETDDIIDVKASGLLPAINGLQIGIVTALEGDPDGEFRVKVRMPLIGESEGVWARVALLDAGENRASFFRPEIEDEVVLGFLNDDPRNPVILGMLNSSAKPSPIEPSDDNHEKGFVTRSELKLIFDDDKKSITIETPNGNTILISDDEGKIEVTDENNNKMTMDSSGILMESASEIVIKSNGDVNIEGTNVNISASAQLKAEGSAGAELSSGGMTDVKGSIVKIN